MKHALLVLIMVMVACGGGARDSEELGSFTLPVTVATATHSYRLQGTISLYQNMVQLSTINISADAPSVTVGDLEPGNYDVFLSISSLTKDGIGVPFTMISVNPHPVTITAGATTIDNWAFSVAGDPVEFECTPETCGSLSFTVSVTEIPPS